MKYLYILNFLNIYFFFHLFFLIEINVVMRQAKFIKKRDCKMLKCKICLQSLQRNPDAERKKQSSVVVRLTCKHEFHTFCIFNYHEYILKKYQDNLSKNLHFKCAICEQIINSYDCTTFASLQQKFMSFKDFQRFMKSDYTGSIEN